MDTQPIRYAATPKKKDDVHKNAHHDLTDGDRISTLAVLLNQCSEDASGRGEEVSRVHDGDVV